MYVQKGQLILERRHVLRICCDPSTAHHPYIWLLAERGPGQGLPIKYSAHITWYVPSEWTRVEKRKQRKRKDLFEGEGSREGRKECVACLPWAD